MSNHGITVLVLIEYIRASIEVLMEIKVEDLAKHKMKIKDHQNKSRFTDKLAERNKPKLDNSSIRKGHIISTKPPVMI